MQGHVDGVGTVASIERSDRNIYLSVDLDPNCCVTACRKGRSRSAESASPSRRSPTRRPVNIIPETWKRTSLRDRRVRRSGEYRGGYPCALRGTTATRRERSAKRRKQLAGPDNAHCSGDTEENNDTRISTYGPRLDRRCSASRSPQSEWHRGGMVLVVDDFDREDEADFLMAADHATADDVNFMAQHGRGLICQTITGERARELGPAAAGDAEHRAPRNGVYDERRRGERRDERHIRRRPGPHDPPRGPRGERSGELARPGHVFPIVAEAGGVFARRGHTEAGCDLARLAGCSPSAVICEVMAEDGTMARGSTRLRDRPRARHTAGERGGRRALPFAHRRRFRDSRGDGSNAHRARSVRGDGVDERRARVQRAGDHQLARRARPPARPDRRRWCDSTRSA